MNISGVSSYNHLSASENSDTNKFDNGVVSEYYTPKDLAIKFDLSPRTIEKYAQKKLIPGQIKIGRLNRFSKAIIDKYSARFGGQLLLPSISPILKFHSNVGRS